MSPARAQCDWSRVSEGERNPGPHTMCWGDLGFHSDKEAIGDLGILKMIVLADVWRIDHQGQHRSRAVRWKAFLFSGCDSNMA